MSQTGDRPFDWVAALALASGAAVMIPSLVVLGVSILAAVLAIF